MIINQRWILGYIIPLSYRFSDMPKNYKSHYNSRLDSIFGSKLPIRSSSKFVFDCGYTEIPFCSHFINHPVQKVHSLPNHRDYIISMVIIFSKWILKFSLYFSSGFLLCYIFMLHLIIFLYYICV